MNEPHNDEFTMSDGTKFSYEKRIEMKLDISFNEFVKKYESGEIPKESPFIEQPAYNYDKHRDETTIPGIKAILKTLADNADKLIYDSKAVKEDIINDQSEVAQKVMKIIIDNNIPDCDMQFTIDSLQAVLHGLFSVITRQKEELEKEYMARTLGTRNPGDQHYSSEYATLKDLFIGLEKIRTEQKDDPYGYFYTKK